jgi:hypothetical protein
VGGSPLSKKIPCNEGIFLAYFPRSISNRKATLHKEKVIDIFIDEGYKLVGE